MEELRNVTEKNSERRRSNVFRRRSSMTFIPPPPQRIDNVHEYKSKAKEEISNWHQLITSRKDASKDALENYTKMKNNKPTISWDMAKQYLNESDVGFLSQRPDYFKIGEDLNYLMEAVIQLKFMIAELNSKTDTVNMFLDARTNNLKNAVCLYPEVDRVNKDK